jgi:hypothetical protein
MRLAIARSSFYNADVYCQDSRLAKKILREHPVSIMAIEFDLVGRENGCDVIQWGKRVNVLPEYIVLIERDRVRRTYLVNALCNAGFRSGDNTTFFKL